MKVLIVSGIWPPDVGGPASHAPDVADFRPLVAAALARVGIGRIAADAGFDSEPNHTFARCECRVRSIIRAKRGRPTDKPARGHYRRLMQKRFDLTAYRDRVQVETVISMLKRRLDAFVRGRTTWSQRREMRLKVLTHNVMILLRIQVFYRAGLTTRYDCRHKTVGRLARFAKSAEHMCRAPSADGPLLGRRFCSSSFVRS